MKLRTTLYLGFGAMLLFALLLLVISFSMLNQLNTNINNIVKEDYEKTRIAMDIRNQINLLNRELYTLILDPTPSSLDSRIARIETTQLNASRLIDSLSLIIHREEAKQMAMQLRSLLTSYHTIQQDVITLVKNGQRAEAASLLLYDTQAIPAKLYQTAEELKKFQENLMDQTLVDSRNQYNFATKTMLILLLLNIAMGFAVTLLVMRNTTHRLQKLQVGINKVEYSEVDQLPRIEVLVNDEIGAIAVAFNNMTQALEDHAKHEKEYKQAMEEYSWLKSSIAEISTMYQSVQSLYSLAQKFISQITPMVGASYGVFYIREGQSSQTQLIKLASYAYDGQHIGRESFQLGEGLVGQCALENKTIYLNQVPDNYMRITSGLGQSTPKQIILLPVEYEGQVLAVIEIASFEEIHMLRQTLLIEVLSNLGITITSISGNMQVQKLLNESQTLTEELQSQSEELQIQQEELKSINEKLEEQYRNSEQKSKELEKTKEELEEKARQVALSSKYKSEFMANMSHELRTPLNSLLILAKILADNKDNNLTNKQIEFANTIYSSGNDLLLLINDILDLSKIESGKMEVYPVHTKFSEIQIAIKRQFEPIAFQKGLSFDIKLDAHLPLTFMTDEQRLLQILQNLLSNAFKFTEHGSVNLFISKAEHLAKDDPLQSLSSNREMIAFAVRDTGIGVAKHKQQLIFEAFQQADGTTSRKYGGTGLGLSISRELAHLLNGRIEIESGEAEGSTFTLYLPVEYSTGIEESTNVLQEIAATDLSDLSSHAATIDAHYESPSSPTPISNLKQREGRLDGKTILVVDDDMRNVFALTTALEKENVNVVFADNGKDGIKVLQQHASIDLVLMDIMMPEMDGYEALKTIRSLPKFQSLPIIALTAKAMKNDREKCIDAGASDYISKPVNLEQLYSLMRVWLYR